MSPREKAPIEDWALVGDPHTAALLHDEARRPSGASTRPSTSSTRQDVDVGSTG